MDKFINLMTCVLPQHGEDTDEETSSHLSPSRGSVIKMTLIVNISTHV